MKIPDIEYSIDLIKMDVPTANGRIYSKEAINKLVEETNKKTVVPLHFNLGSDLASIVGIVKNAKVVDDQIVVKIQLLDTPKAVNIKAALHDRKAFCITPTTVGLVDENHQVTVQDVKHYNITARIL